MSLGTAFEPTLGAARVGAEWAWRDLYREFAPVIARYLKARRAAEPEDLVGDVFVQVVRKLDWFSGGEDDFRGWIVTIAHHRFVDSLRSRSRRPVDPVADEILAQEGGHADLEEQALTKLRSDEVQHAIRRLSPDQQDVVFLRLIAGLSIAEVADALGKKPGAVKALQSRAVAALKRDLPQAVSS